MRFVGIERDRVTTVKDDWGDVCREDRQANDHALLDGSRLLSAHRTSLGEKLWIITEAADDWGRRSPIPPQQRESS
jgi:hypothetical protein